MCGVINPEYINIPKVGEKKWLPQLLWFRPINRVRWKYQNKNKDAYLLSTPISYPSSVKYFELEGCSISIPWLPGWSDKVKEATKKIEREVNRKQCRWFLHKLGSTGLAYLKCPWLAFDLHRRILDSWIRSVNICGRATGHIMVWFAKNLLRHSYSHMKLNLNLVLAVFSTRPQVSNQYMWNQNLNYLNGHNWPGWFTRAIPSYHWQNFVLIFLTLYGFANIFFSGKLTLQFDSNSMW